MVVVPVYDLNKPDKDKIGMAFVHDDVNQAIIMQDEVLVAKMVAENNELQHVVTSFDHDTIDEIDVKAVPSEDVLKNP